MKRHTFIANGAGFKTPYFSAPFSIPKTRHWRVFVIWTLAIIAVIANLADALTTFIAIHYFNLAEANKVMAFFYHYPFIGYPLKILLGLWLFLPLPYCWYAWAKKKYTTRTILIIWSIAASVFLLLAISNLLKIV